MKNLFENADEIIGRIENLKPNAVKLWGKMDVSQMLAHVQMPIRIAFGTHQPKGSFLLRLIGPLFKSKLWDENPYKHSLPTDPTFIMTGSARDFQKEKEALLNLINNFIEENLVNERHPVFGKLTKENWNKAMWKHLDHHLQQFGV